MRAGDGVEGLSRTCAGPIYVKIGNWLAEYIFVGSEVAGLCDEEGVSDFDKRHGWVGVTPKEIFRTSAYCVGSHDRTSAGR